MIEPLAGTAVALVFWVTLVLYGFSSGWWLFEVTALARGWRAENESESGRGSAGASARRAILVCAN